jgi:hypothetical protein
MKKKTHKQSVSYFLENFVGVRALIEDFFFILKHLIQQRIIFYNDNRYCGGKKRIQECRHTI